MKVSATNSALNLLSELQVKYGEKLMFHQSGGCCDGSAPMCFQEGEFPLGDNDVKLGEIGGVPFYMNGDQYEKWKHTDLTIDNSLYNVIFGIMSCRNFLFFNKFFRFI